MKYISTRGQAPELSFEDAMLTGLARDGGLYVPAHIPTLSAEEIAERLDSTIGQEKMGLLEKLAMYAKAAAAKQKPNA